MRFAPASLVVFLFCATCGPSGSSGGPDAGGLDAGSSACGTQVGGPTLPLVISTSDYTAGTLCAASSGAACTARNLETLSADTVLAWHDAHTLVALSYALTNAGVIDSVRFYDTRVTPPLVISEPTALLPGERGAGNARGYFPISEREGYVARFNQTSLMRVDLRAGTARRGPELASFRGAGSHPRPKHFARVGTELWVTLLRLDETLANPTALGAIALLDPAADAVLDADPSREGTQLIELPFANPAGPLSVRNGRAVLACAGVYTRLDGGVVLVDGATHAVSVVAREEALDGNVDAAIWLDDERLLLRVVGRTGTTVDMPLAIDASRLVEWSLRTNSMVREWLRVGEWTLTEPVLGSDGRVYVGDRGDEATRRPHGIRVFDPHDGSELTPSPVSCGLQPYDLLPALSAAR